MANDSWGEIMFRDGDGLVEIAREVTDDDDERDPLVFLRLHLEPSAMHPGDDRIVRAVDQVELRASQLRDVLDGLAAVIAAASKHGMLPPPLTLQERHDKTFAALTIAETLRATVPDNDDDDEEDDDDGEQWKRGGADG